MASVELPDGNVANAAGIRQPAMGMSSTLPGTPGGQAPEGVVV